MKVSIYIILLCILLLGIILFDYAFPELSVQQGMAATLSICCISFAVTIYIKYELKDDNQK